MGRKFENILETIGNTPLVRLDKLAAKIGCQAQLVGKLEFFNPIGSVKDRIGVSMIEAMEEAGQITPGKTTLIAVAGCVAQAEGAEIMRRAPFVDIVLGPQTYHRLPELIARAERSAGDGVLDIEFPPESKFDHLPDAAPTSSAAFLTIQEG